MISLIKFEGFAVLAEAYASQRQQEQLTCAIRWLWKSTLHYRYWTRWLLHWYGRHEKGVNKGCSSFLPSQAGYMSSYRADVGLRYDCSCLHSSLWTLITDISRMYSSVDCWLVVCGSDDGAPTMRVDPTSLEVLRLNHSANTCIFP